MGMRSDTNIKHPPMQDGWIDRPHRFAELGDLRLESGEVIHDYCQSYVTHGTLNVDRSNLVLACISLTGNHHRLDFLIGLQTACRPRPPIAPVNRRCASRGSEFATWCRRNTGCSPKC